MAPCGDFPPIDTFARVFDGTPPVRFVEATGRPRGRRQAGARRIDPLTLYDARITLERVVPTRSRCWHDLMNALVWGTFPAAKLALHARQHRAVSERLSPFARSLPPARTRELDALAILDEGGVAIVVDDASCFRAAGVSQSNAVNAAMRTGAADAIIFGHAVYESIALGVSPAVVAAIVVERDEGDPNIVRAAEHALAHAIADRSRLQTPEELTRIDVGAIDFLGAATRSRHIPQ